MTIFLNVKYLARGLVATLLAVVCHAPMAAEAPDLASKAAEPRVVADSAVDAGRYIIRIAGCNDCHTPNWMETAGDVPEEEWLTGVPIGWRGPWGTTYASNLRRIANELTEDGFVALLKSRVERPPMPWMNVNRLSEQDARAIYHYIRSLGIRGEKMPVAVGPDAEPQTPYFLLEPLEGPRFADAVTESGAESGR